MSKKQDEQRHRLQILAIVVIVFAGYVGYRIYQRVPPGASAKEVFAVLGELAHDLIHGEKTNQ